MLPTFKLTLFGKILVGFILAFVLTVALAVIDYYSTIRLTEAHEQLEESKNRILLLEETASLVKDIQRSHRGFIVTRDNRFLDPYYNSLQIVGAVKARLVTEQWPEQVKPSAQKITSLLDKKVDLAHKALFNTNYLTGDSAIKKIQEGKQIADSIYVLTAASKRYEQDSQKTINNSVQRWLTTNKIVISSSLVTFLILMIIGLLKLAKTLKERNNLYHALQRTNEEINDKNEELKTLIEGLNKTNNHLNETVAELESTKASLHQAQIISRTGSFKVTFPDERFEYSESLKNLLGVDQLETMADFLRVIHEEDRGVINLREPALVTRDLRANIGGAIKYLRFAGQLMNENNVSFYLGSVTDITEEKNALKASEELNTALEQTNQDLQFFSYAISHDIKSPLRKLNISTEHALEKMQMDSSNRQTLQNILKSTHRLNNLVDKLLTYSHAGSSAITKERVDMHAMVLEIIDEIHHDNAVPIIVPTPLHEISADPGLIRQVWINLITNAVKFSANVENPQVQITSQLSSDYVEYSVSDNGVGFDQKRVNELFEVFKRLHNSEYDGSGIGLAIVKRIVTGHGGEASAVSEKGKGSRFWFRLPRS